MSKTRSSKRVRRCVSTKLGWVIQNTDTNFLREHVHSTNAKCGLHEQVQATSNTIPRSGLSKIERRRFQDYCGDFNKISRMIASKLPGGIELVLKRNKGIAKITNFFPEHVATYVVEYVWFTDPRIRVRDL